jgi:F-type H+-transporting ATPase subunit gamma
MESLKIIRNRIRTIESIIKATNTMKMVTTVKLSKVHSESKGSPQSIDVLGRMFHLSLYECIYRDIIPEEHWLINAGDGPSLILVLSTNQGFCGPFNQFISKKAMELIAQHPGAYVEVFGKKGGTIPRNRDEEIDLDSPQTWHDIWGFARCLSSMTFEYVRKGVSKIFVVSGHFVNAITQKAKSTQIFPVTEVLQTTRRDEASAAFPHIIEIEGNKLSFLEDLFGEYITRFLSTIITEHLVSEFSARVMSMDNSVRNAKDMAEKLGILYNRMRQDKITRELTEIISSTECS